MPVTRKVGVFVGSLRKESFTRKVANAVTAVAPAGLQFEFIDIGEVGHYNQDLESAPPDTWIALRQKVSAVDALLFATPEYNRSVPGVLKNAIDVASRPYGKSAWNGKPGAVISVSPGALSAFGANHHLRQSLVFLNVPTMQQPEAYIGGADKLFDPSGNLTNDSTREFLRKFGEAFAAWIEVILAPKA
jgi:chromate reductase, NAD(P)H dehydrogenase (quinone)